MKTQKRSSSSRAYCRGYQAGVAGRSWRNCPHKTIGVTQQSWMKGWEECIEDHWGSYNPHVQAQKIYNF